MAEKEKEKAKSVTEPGKLESFGASLIKWGIAILIIVGGWNILFGDEKPIAGSAGTTAADRQYVTPAHNFSAETGDFFIKKVKAPAAGKWVSVKIPMGYDVYKTPGGPVVYDYGGGRALVHDAPGLKIDSKSVPNAFDLTSEGEREQIVEIRCYKMKKAKPVIVAGHN